MDKKEFKFNKEEPTYSMPDRILCKKCKNALPSGVTPGYNKQSCYAYNKKPIDVLMGRSIECPKFIMES